MFLYISVDDFFSLLDKLPDDKLFIYQVFAMAQSGTIPGILVEPE